MLRRFSINFALFSMLLDGLSTLFGLFLAVTLRPVLNSLTIIKDINSNETALVPPLLFVVIPLLWVIIFSSMSIYDGRKFLRVADELAALFLATFIASISTAGLLYLSYRDVSRALFIVFVSTAFLLSLSWRMMTRMYFRSRRELSVSARRLLVVGCGPLGQSVGTQIRDSVMDHISLVGFIDDDSGKENKDNALGGLADLKKIINRFSVTDVVIALPYSVYQRMSEIVAYLDDQPVGVWVALGFFDLALYRTSIEDFAGIPMIDLRALCNR